MRTGAGRMPPRAIATGSAAMTEIAERLLFEQLNPAYGRVFKPGRLTIGLVVPVENYAVGANPAMARHAELAELAEQLGFAALWVRDIPFDVPSFGDVGQIFDPFAYLGFLAARTERIALGTASIVLPLRHPAHVAKSAASIDQLSGGRMLLGVASGDRPDEYPAMAIDYYGRGEAFRESFEYIRKMGEERPTFANSLGELSGALDMLPKPFASRIPMLVTGGSHQDREWVARRGDGWMVYPRPTPQLEQVIAVYRQDVARTADFDRPVMHPLYFDALPEGSCGAQPLHLGLRSDLATLRDYLASLEAVGVNHVALNLRFNQLPIETTLKRLAAEVLPPFQKL